MRTRLIVFENEMPEGLKQMANCCVGAPNGNRIGVGVPLKKGVLKRSRLVKPSGESAPCKGEKGRPTDHG